MFCYPGAALNSVFYDAIPELLFSRYFSYTTIFLNLNLGLLLS